MAAPAEETKVDETPKEIVTKVVEKKEPPKELEEDAKKDTAPKAAKEVSFLTPDTTMNVLPSTFGNMLVPLTEGGLSQLMAGARANVGVKSGRHMFEAKIVEHSAKFSVRLGFSTEGCLFMGETDNSICFDAEGQMIFNKKKTRCSQAFARDVMVAVVLNLDASSPNANTISVFKDGRRCCQPQPLPEELKGKTLFPTVSFKSSTVHYNFAAPAVPLPFTCKSILDATTKDGVVKKYSEPEGGKHTALFPISLPDEGSFDWLDSFLEKNEDYTELSDRAFTDWATKSGLQVKGYKASNDKPGQSPLDNLEGIKKLLMEVAAMQPRNFVIMEVKGNLVKEDRDAMIAKFKGSSFKTVAEVILAEPPSTFKKLVQVKTLKAKQDKSDREHKVKFAGEKREWATKKKLKEQEKAKKKKEKEMKKKNEELAKKREAAMKKATKDMERKKLQAEGKEVPPEEEEKEEEPVEAVESEEEPDEPMDPEPEETPAPKVTLTAEEKAVKFVAHSVPDLTAPDLARAFVKFSLPEEGEFDMVKYSWGKEKDASAYLKSWIMAKKQTTRVEDITPSAWFKEKSKSWQSAFGQWKNKQGEYKNMLSKKAAAKAAKAAKKLAAEKKAKADAEKALADAKKKAQEALEKKEKGEEVEEEKVEEKKPEKAPVVEEEEEEEEEPEVVDFDGLDVFGIEDILDVTGTGGKVPIFRDFQFEDFTMMVLRFELHLLVHSFAKDCDDPDRAGIHIDHLAFYYQKYWGKELNLNSFGVKTTEELVALVGDSIAVKKSVVEALIPADFDSHAVFAKITEAARRERNLLVDMGDESKKLKIKGGGGGGQQNGGEKRKWEAGEDGGQKRENRGREDRGGNKWGGDWGRDGGKGGKWAAMEAMAAMGMQDGAMVAGMQSNPWVQKGGGGDGGNKGYGKGGNKDGGKDGGKKGGGKGNWGKNRW